MDRADLSPRIYYLCPDISSPTGGIKQIYRHVDILNQAGQTALVAHEKPGFRCTWFDNRTRVASVSEIHDACGLDFVVIPETHGPGLAGIARGCRKVIFNQNCYYTFLGYPIEEPPAEVAYLDPEVAGAMVVSEDSAAYLRFAFPHLHVERIHNGIDVSRFLYSPGKRNRIAFLAAKNPEDIAQVVNLLRIRGKSDGYEFVALRGKSEAEVAASLREAAIFLHFSYREGFSLVAAEAMACGCVAVGYPGGGGKEYWHPDFSYPVQNGDILGFVKAVEEVIRLRSSEPSRIEAKTRAAAEFIRSNYSLEREERDVVSFWKRMASPTAAAPPSRNPGIRITARRSGRAGG